MNFAMHEFRIIDEMTIDDFIASIVFQRYYETYARIVAKKRTYNVTQRRVTRSNVANVRNIRRAKQTRYFNAY